MARAGVHHDGDHQRGYQARLMRSVTPRVSTGAPYGRSHPDTPPYGPPAGHEGGWIASQSRRSFRAPRTDAATQTPPAGHEGGWIASQSRRSFRAESTTSPTARR